MVYQASTVGSIGGGWISAALLKRGWPPNRAREAAMLICALAVTSVIFVGTAHGNMWLAVALVGVATAAHQGWSANLYTLASDLFPRGAVGSVVGLGGLAGAVGRHAGGTPGRILAGLVAWRLWAAVRDRGIDLPGGLCGDSLAGAKTPDCLDPNTAWHCR